MIKEAELDTFIAAQRHEANMENEGFPLKHIKLNHG